MVWKHPTLEKSHYQSKYQIRFCYIGIDRAQGLTKNMELAHRKGSVAGLLLNLTHLQVVLNTSLLYVQVRLLDIQHKPDLSTITFN